MDKVLKKNVLFYVVIRAHFSELLRAAIALSETNEFSPVFYFQTLYSNLNQDIKICESHGFKCIILNQNVPRLPSTQRPYNALVKSFYKCVDFLKRVGRNVGRVCKRIILNLGKHANRPIKQIVVRVLYLLYMITTTMWRSMWKLIFNVLTLGGRIRFELGFFAKFINELHRARHEMNETQKIIIDYKIKIVILPEDNPSYGTQFVIKMAQSMETPVAILPYSIVTVLEPAESFYREPAYQCRGIANRIVGRVFPHWVYTHKNVRTLRDLSSRICVTEYFHIAAPKPWAHNSGHADALFVESDRMRKHYINEGLNEKNLVMTGAIYNDQLSRLCEQKNEGRIRLCKEFSWDTKKPLVVCAMPPSQFPRECEFSNYAELFNFWICTLRAAVNCNVVVRPHPRTEEDIDKLKKFESDNLKIVSHDTAQLVPLCDLYVASVSATIRWAIACGKPVLNYDVYEYRYPDYLEAPGVIHVYKSADFTREYTKLATQPAELERVTLDQMKCKDEWGQLDGHARDRISAAINGLIDKYK